MSQEKKYHPHSWPQALLLTVWVGALAGGFWQLMLYANTPGQAAHATPEWPAGTKLSRAPSSPTLVIFAHPRCPCSDASVSELERLMPHAKGRMKVFIVFFKPDNRSDDWVKEALWKKAKGIPEVQLVLDDRGVEAARFGAKVSGQAFLYDSNGQLVFSGGITPERGHVGDNRGTDSIIAFIETGKTTRSETPVFGCSLKNPERAIAGAVK